jgi:DtxR family Mn-dependent transcriptional regulator
MLQKLAVSEASFVKYERHRGVQLSDTGRLRALEVLRHHRLIETFLYEVLDYPLDEVHDEAERLEHFISERFEERIAAKLGHPRIDPHGHSIPSLAGEMPAVRSVRLTDVVGPGSYAVESVSDRDPCTLRLLEAHGIRPQVRLRVMESRPEGYVVKVGRAVAEIELSRAVAGEVRVVAAAK